MGEGKDSPGEDTGQAADGQHPVESVDLSLLACRDNVADQSHRRGRDDRYQGSARTVDVAENLGGLSHVRQGSQSAAGAVDGRVAHGQHGDEDDGVHDGGDGLDAGVSDGDNER